MIIGLYFLPIPYIKLYSVKDDKQKFVFQDHHHPRWDRPKCQTYGNTASTLCSEQSNSIGSWLCYVSLCLMNVLVDNTTNSMVWLSSKPNNYDVLNLLIRYFQIATHQFSVQLSDVLDANIHNSYWKIPNESSMDCLQGYWPKVTVGIPVSLYLVKRFYY